MREHDPSEERLPAIGHPPPEREQVAKPNENADFAEEHDAVAVTEDLTSGQDTEREDESPRGWSGLQS